MLMRRHPNLAATALFIGVIALLAAIAVWPVIAVALIALMVLVMIWVACRSTIEALTLGGDE